MKHAIFFGALLTILGCPSEHYFSDTGFISSVEAFVPELIFKVDQVECKTIKGQHGACVISKPEKSSAQVEINLNHESQVTWESSCTLEVNGQQTDNGSFISKDQVLRIQYGDIKPKGEICVLGIQTLNTRRDDPDSIAPSSQGSQGLIYIIVTDSNYVALAKPFYRFKDDNIEIAADKYSKYLRLNRRGKSPKIYFKKTLLREEKKDIVSIESESDIGRRSFVAVH